jgi:hypothetical protein
MSSSHRQEPSHRRRLRGGALLRALAIDVGSFYKAQRQAQAAADAGALAASQDLPSGTTAAASDGTTYATTNYPGATVAVQTPYNGSSTQVKVTVSAVSPAILGSIFGVTSAHISASAVAGGSSSTGAPSAVFAKSTNCGDKGVTFNGTSIVISGGTHSNGVVWANGSSDNFGTTTYGGPNNCSLTKNGSGNTFGGGNPTVDPTNQPWPFDYSTLTFPSVPACTPGPNTFIAASFSWTSSGTIPPGIYCATQNDITLGASNLNATGCTFVAEQGKIVVSGSSITTSGNFFAPGANGVIQLSGSGITVNGVFEATGSNGQINISASGLTGNATMVGNAMQMNGSGISIAPYPGYNNLTAYQTGPQTLTINGSGYLSGGSIFTPNADIELNGSGNATGMMEGLDVTINGSAYTITGNGPPVGGSSSGSTLLQ